MLPEVAAEPAPSKIRARTIRRRLLATTSELPEYEPLPPRTVAPHLLITAANVFIEYPPYDMN